MREELEELHRVLGTHNDFFAANQVQGALKGTEAELMAFLHSNELWGGAGSIADQAGYPLPSREARRNIELALVKLGEEQLRCGATNVRTRMWVDAFSGWRNKGI